MQPDKPKATEKVLGRNRSGSPTKWVLRQIDHPYAVIYGVGFDQSPPLETAINGALKTSWSVSVKNRSWHLVVSKPMVLGT